MLIPDFSRMDAEGRKGGDTTQCCVINLKVADQESRRLENFGFYYFSTKMEAKPDPDFVGTAFRSIMKDIVSKNPNVESFACGQMAPVPTSNPIRVKKRRFTSKSNSQGL